MEDNILEAIDMRELGQELQIARKKRGLTQEAAARIIDVARTTITAIEKGERRIKPGELIKLARAYGRQVSDFVRPRPHIESFSEPFQVQFRGPYWRSEEDEAEIAPFISELEELCRDYLELEEITGAPLSRKYPPEYEIKGLSTAQAAESVAMEERNRLDLGDGPIPMLRDILEQDVGLRIFYLALPGKFSEIYHFDHQLGGCIAINSQHPPDRGLWSLAHGYSHFLVHRHRAEVLIEDAYQRKPESEQFADYFARYFLMPTSGLTRRLNDIRRIKGRVTVEDLLDRAHYYGVSFSAFMDRLEMGLLPAGTGDHLRKRGLNLREKQRQLGLEPPRNEKLPKRYQYLAFVALERDLITEGQFARFLHIDRVAARRAAAALREETAGAVEGTNPDQDLTQPLGA